MPAFGSKRVFAIYKSTLSMEDGIHLAINLLVTWETNVWSGSVEAIFQPADTLNTIATVIRDACKTKAEQVSGLTFLNNQIFLPSYS